jgi:hypothetical protein
MSPRRSIAVVLLALACNRAQSPPAAEPEPAAPVAPASTPSPTITAVEPSDEFSVMHAEGFGALRIGMKEAEMLAALPGAKAQGECAPSEVDGGSYRWFRDAKAGVDIVVSCDGDKPVGSIHVVAPSTLTSRRGIGLGATAEAVTKAYADVLSREEPPTEDGIVAGSIYGGLVFSLKDGKVTEMFLGAMAE